MHYQNITGVWGTAPDTDLVNWQLLGKSKTNGYILEQDCVKYDVTNNIVVYRADKRNNEVDSYTSGGFNSLVTFQWGRDVTKNNKVLGNSIMRIANSYSTFNGNILENGRLTDNTYYDLVTAGDYTNNRITEGASVTMVKRTSKPIGNGRNAGKFSNNYFGETKPILDRLIDKAEKRIIASHDDASPESGY